MSDINDFLDAISECTELYGIEIVGGSLVSIDRERTDGFYACHLDGSELEWIVRP